MPTNIKQAYAMVNGQKVVASYDDDSGLWSVETNAPSQSSWNQPDHVYQITLHAEDLAGNTAEMTSSDPTYGEQLEIRVLETTPPVATIVSPTQDAVLGASTQNVVMELQDTGDSGLNMSTVVFKINNQPISEGLDWQDGADGKKTCTYVATNLSDGSNTMTLQVTDNDGNESNLASVTFMISTAAPQLSVTTPTEGLITNSPSLTVSGTVAPGSELVTISSVTVNGDNAIVSEGTFIKEVTLTEGENTVTVIATDSLGKTTTVTRHVTLDTKAPVISDVVAESTTVNVGGTIRITFKITDPE